LGRVLMGPIGSILKTVGSMMGRLVGLGARIIASIFTGLPGLFLAGGAIMAGWLASVAMVVNLAVKSAQIKKVYKDEADTRLATQEAAALGIEGVGPGGTEKSTEVLAIEAADKLLDTEGGDANFIAAMNEAGLDADDIKKEGGFTAEQSQKLFRARSEQRGIADEKRRFYEEAGHEGGELVTENSLFGGSKTYRRGISDADAKSRNLARTMRDGTVPVGGGEREKASDTKHFDHDEMDRVTGQTFSERMGETRDATFGAEPEPDSTSPTRASTMDLVKEHEGERFVPYEDTEGNWTVGYGHLLGGPDWSGDKNKVYTKTEIDKFFDEDWGSHAKAARDIPGFEDLDSTQQGALEELSFNMGPAWYKGFPKMMAAMERGDTGEAVKELLNSNWAGQVGEGRRDSITGRLQGPTLMAGGTTLPGNVSGGMGGGGVTAAIGGTTITNNNSVTNIIPPEAAAEDPDMAARIWG
jgi:GH24 family phage-related lysozyme (muramidase)